MSAGLSPDIGADLPDFIIPITEPPVVEIDTEVTAAYIRLRHAEIARTEPFPSEDGLVMLDFDAEGNVVGMEIIGRQELGIRELIRMLPVRTTDAILDRTRYVSAKLQAA